MAVEYWLQKKSLGGWSTVTWYGELDQAKLNYQRCVGKDGLSGYSWRLVSVTVIEQAMLDEVVDIAASPDAVDAIMYGLEPIQAKPKSNGWGDTKSGWSDIPSDSSKPDHGLVGSVWLIHHKDKIKKRIAAVYVDEMLKLGYERGGPKTKFRE